MARWRSGYAAACKAVNTGSIPVRASNSLVLGSDGHHGDESHEGGEDAESYRAPVP